MKLLKTLQDARENQLETVWRVLKNYIIQNQKDEAIVIKKKKLRKNISKQSSQTSIKKGKSRSKISGKSTISYLEDETFPGNDMFIAENLNLIRCLESWLRNINAAYEE